MGWRRAMGQRRLMDQRVNSIGSLLKDSSFGHTMVETPDPIRTLKLSTIGLA